MKNKIHEFLNHLRLGSPAAARVYPLWLNRLYSMFPYDKIEDLKSTDLDAFFSQITDRYKPRTVALAMFAIKCFLRYLLSTNHHTVHPELYRAPKFHYKPIDIITPLEHQSILKVIDTNTFQGLRDYVMISLLHDTGCRVSEICSMRVEMINRNVCGATIETKKTSMCRQISWHPSTHHMLTHKYLPLRRALKHFGGGLFVRQVVDGFPGSDYTPRSLQRRLIMYKNRAGIRRRIYPHLYRHTWVIDRRRLGAPHSFLQKGVGHRNPMSIHHYDQFVDTEHGDLRVKYLDKVYATKTK